MRAGTVEMVSVEWIMQNTTDSVDGFGSFDNDTQTASVDYEYLVSNKATDGGFGDLVGTILEKGFRVPIVLVKNYCDTGSQQEALVHGNGHHRMAAAILLCLEEIPVYWSKGKQYMCSAKSDTEETLCNTIWDGLEDELQEVFADA